MSKAKVLITGIPGQDGAYIAAFLLGKGYGERVPNQAANHLRNSG